MTKWEKTNREMTIGRMLIILSVLRTGKEIGVQPQSHESLLHYLKRDCGKANRVYAIRPEIPRGNGYSGNP